MLHGNSSSSSNLDNTHRFLRESPLLFLRLKTVGLNTVAGSVQSLWGSRGGRLWPGEAASRPNRNARAAFKGSLQAGRLEL
jgi:hypothetical protein